MVLNERISREQMLMEVAHVVARRGTCSRLQVGVVFAREGRILATGYNGAPRGVDHCIHESYTWPTTRQYMEENYPPPPIWVEKVVRDYFEDPDPGTQFFFDGRTVSNQNGGCTVSEHAERNAIAFSAGEGIRLGGSDAYCTHAPCLDCARALLGAGVARVTYETPYRLTHGVELLHSAGIEVVAWQSPS